MFDLTEGTYLVGLDKNGAETRVKPIHGVSDVFFGQAQAAVLGQDPGRQAAASGGFDIETEATLTSSNCQCTSTTG
jgi:acetyl-CoA acetyltransferase